MGCQLLPVLFFSLGLPLLSRMTRYCICPSRCCSTLVHLLPTNLVFSRLYLVEPVFFTTPCPKPPSKKSKERQRIERRRTPPKLCALHKVCSLHCALTVDIAPFLDPQVSPSPRWFVEPHRCLCFHQKKTSNFHPFIHRKRSTEKETSCVHSVFQYVKGWVPAALLLDSLFLVDP